MKGFTPGDPRAVAAGAKGGAIRGAQVQAHAVRTWCQRYPGIDPEIVKAIYVQGYSSGFSTGRRKSLGAVSATGGASVSCLVPADRKVRG